MFLRGYKKSPLKLSRLVYKFFLILFGTHPTVTDRSSNSKLDMYYLRFAWNKGSFKILF